MSRRTERAAQDAADKASEAARVLQQRSQEAKQEKVEPSPEPETKQDAKVMNVKARNEPRRLAMEEIIRSRQGDEAVEQTEPQSEHKQETPPEPKAEAHKEEPKPEVTPEPVTEPEPAKPEMVRVKVDGEEMEVSKEEVDAAGGVAAYQKQKAADNRLEKANRALAESRQLQAAVMELARRHAEKPEEPQPTIDQFIAQKLDAIRFGTPEEGAAALNEILQRSVPRLDPNVYVTQAVAQVRRQSAVDKFRDEFADVVNSPVLMRAAMYIENERLKEIDPRISSQYDWMDFYRKIGNEIRSVIPRQSQPATPAPTQGSTSQPSDKEARKASIVTLPSASARAEPPKEEKPETRDDILKEMRKSRGLSTG